MNKRVLAWIFIIICLLKGQTGIVAASCTENTINGLEENIDGILAWEEKNSHAASLQEWLDQDLSKNAGTSPADWIVVSLCQYNKKLSYQTYLEALNQYAEEMDSNRGTDYQRIAFVYSVLNENLDYVQNVIDQKTGSLGIMSYLYGLELLDSRAYENREITRDGIIKKILALQLSDGGWALSGESGDVDVTAMAVQALALYYNDADVKESIDKALDLLSECQSQDGDYKSYGTPNLESTAQVLVALSSLSIKWESDERFIKNGNTVLDGILKYQLKDGSFSHIAQGKSNEIATVQGMYAMISAWREKKGLTSLYRFTEKKADRGEAQEEEIPEATSISQDAGTRNTDIDTIYLTGDGIKQIMIICLVVIMMGLWLRLFFEKKFHWKKALLIGVGASMAICYIASSRIQTSEEYEIAAIQGNGPFIEVTVSIRCDTVGDKIKSSFIPKTGILLDQAECQVPEEATVFDALVIAAKENHIALDYSGNTASGIYVRGIQYLYEYDYGALSGWMYQVNDQFPNVSCSGYSLNDGDEVVWAYTLDLGKDVEEK